MKRKKNSLSADICRDWDLYLMLLLPLGFLLVFQYVPMGGLVMAFQDFDIFEGFWSSPFVGFANFRRLFATSEFFSVLCNTLLISLYKIIFFFPIPILLALMLNEVKNKAYKRTVQTIVYLPHFLSWVIISGLLFDLLSSRGTLNRLIELLGGTRINFLMEPGMFRTIVVASSIWKEVGYSSIVFLAAISGIDPSLYEAAVVDGAGKIKQALYVTLPGIAPMIVVMLLLRVGTIMDANSEQIMAIYNPTVYQTGDVLGTYIYRTGLSNMEYSFAAAAGMFNSVVSFTMVAVCNWVSRTTAGRSLW